MFFFLSLLIVLQFSIIFCWLYIIYIYIIMYVMCSLTGIYAKILSLELPVSALFDSCNVFLFLTWLSLYLFQHGCPSIQGFITYLMLNKYLQAQSLVMVFTAIGLISNIFLTFFCALFVILLLLGAM